MVKPIYIMKLNKQSINMEEYYSGLQNASLSVFSKYLNRTVTCRVCLQDGDSAITSVTNPNGIREVLNVFGAIGIGEDDENPTYLCYVCYKFLKCAISFRKVALRTNETLKRPPMKLSPDHFQNYDTTETLIDEKSNQVFRTKELEYEDEEDTKVQCQICKKILTKAYYNKTHLKLCDPDFPKQYVCDICGKSFKLKVAHNRHRERHETRYIYKCQFCPYAGRYKARLSMHMRVHTGGLKYLCTECPARYFSKGSLSDHIRLKHTKPQHKCDQCDRAFHNNLNLQRHIDVVHMGIKKHECNICSISFGYRRDLMKHQRNVHKRAKLRSGFSKSIFKSRDNCE